MSDKLTADDKVKLDNRLDELVEVLIPQLEREAQLIRVQLGYNQPSLIRVSLETKRRLWKLMDKWGDHERGSLARCVDDSYHAEFNNS